jgi:hypothetical protein
MSEDAAGNVVTGVPDFPDQIRLAEAEWNRKGGYRWCSERGQQAPKATCAAGTCGFKKCGHFKIPF